MDKSPVDLFLQLVDYNDKPVVGESLDNEFKKAIEISEFKLDGDSAESRASEDKPKKKAKKEGPQSRRGCMKRRKRKKEKKGPYCKFEITKSVDASSPSLLLAYCWTISSKEAVFGPKFASAKVTVRKSGGKQFKFLVFTFEEVSVINYSLDVKSEYPEESMTFKFEKISMMYFPQKADGTLDVLRSAEWTFHQADDSSS